MSWMDAEDFCKEKGAHLASVTSSAINDYLLEGKEKRDMYHLWIGGSDQEVEGIWKWTDCSPWEFTFWRSGEPNNHQARGSRLLESPFMVITISIITITSATHRLRFSAAKRFAQVE